MGRNRAVRVLAVSGAAILMVGASLAGVSVGAPPASGDEAALSPTRDVPVRSATIRQSLPKRGTWTKKSPPKGPCQLEPDAPDCEMEPEEIQQPDIPEVPSPLGDVPQSAEMTAVSAGPTRVGPRALSMVLKKEVDTTTNFGAPLDTSVAASGSKIVYTQNSQITLSANGGTTFTQPRSVASLYADSPDGGVCCDMVVNYVPSIDRFVWVTQYWPSKATGKNRYRIAVFPPSAVTSKGISGWLYWDLTSDHFPGSPGFLDFPELSFGDSYAYLGFHEAPAGSTFLSTGVIARIGLVNLRDGLDLAATPTEGRYYRGDWWLGTVAQNTGSRAYWAANTSTSAINVGWWDESVTYLYPEHSIATQTWPNSDYSSVVAGDQWLNTYQGLVLGAARQGDKLYFAWAAGRGTGSLSWLKQPHIQLLTVKGADSGSLAFDFQRAVWASSVAFAYPNVNVMKGDVAMTFSLGGGVTLPHSGLADLTTNPSTYFDISTGTGSCNCARWGDYAAIRPWPNYPSTYGKQWRVAFIASGYAVRMVQLSPTQSQLRQVGAVGALTS